MLESQDSPPLSLSGCLTYPSIVVVSDIHICMGAVSSICMMISRYDTADCKVATSMGLWTLLGEEALILAVGTVWS